MALYPAMGADLVGIHGQLDIFEKSRIDFPEFSLTADDANPLNRPRYQEALTSFLQAISDAVGTPNYQINFTGRNAVHSQGSRP
ncbi:hypothetical protein [Stenotrophomonas sp. 364]|uniref:hypothetical protein n=1 Tax=Stenotrophomonas sp. 364 TaxID=2691571 RepID=UPI0013194793|nr:hypothetical protein [Stenotrophomonas sp. 364]QHB70702.1 hypothetical protein GQ674_04940 [Stenotrophomonas sp. 364]